MAETHIIHRSGGFTLVEMLAAIGILTLGLTAVVGVMSVGVSTRRGAELRHRAVLAVDQVLLGVATDYFPAQPPAEDGAEPPPLEPLIIDPIPDFPELKARVEFTADPDVPNMVLVSVWVSWLEEGLSVGEKFQRVMDRRAPFFQRVARLVEPR